MKVLSIIVIVFSVVAFVAMIVGQFFEKLNTIHPAYKYERAARICGIIGAVCVSIAAIGGLIHVIIPLL